MRLILLRRLAIALGLAFGVALLFVPWLGPLGRGLQAELFGLLAFFFLAAIASTASRGPVVSRSSILPSR